MDLQQEERPGRQPVRRCHPVLRSDLAEDEVGRYRAILSLCGALSGGARYRFAWNASFAVEPAASHPLRATTVGRVLPGRGRWWRVLFQRALRRLPWPP